MTATPGFPPLLRGYATPGDPFLVAQEMAAQGCDGGTVLHNLQAGRLRAAIVFAPEVPLGDAMAMLPLCGIGFQNALGALAPPEVAVHLTWEGGIRLNGAACGALRAAADTSDPGAIPGWLVVGLDLAILPAADEPGERPEETALHAEGCAEIAPDRLLEAWARHVLVWINRWSEEGTAPLHREWTGLAADLDAPVRIAGRSGRALGLGENMGLLIRDGAATHLVPLTELLAALAPETAPGTLERSG